jgi:hypothetical protein
MVLQGSLLRVFCLTMLHCCSSTLNNPSAYLHAASRCVTTQAATRQLKGLPGAPAHALILTQSTLLHGPLPRPQAGPSPGMGCRLASEAACASKTSTQPSDPASAVASRKCMDSSGLLYSRCTGTALWLGLPWWWSVPCALLTSAVQDTCTQAMRQGSDTTAACTESASNAMLAAGCWLLSQTLFLAWQLLLHTLLQERPLHTTIECEGLFRLALQAMLQPSAVNHAVVASPNSTRQPRHEMPLGASRLSILTPLTPAHL